MPTKLRRIAVTEDPDLALALSRASKELPGLSDAALVKELALRGAGTLSVNGSDERMSRIVEATGARPARGNLSEYLRRNPPAPSDPAAPNGLSRALQEQRQERF
jgi:hypothetical protein